MPHGLDGPQYGQCWLPLKSSISKVKSLEENCNEEISDSGAVVRIGLGCILWRSTVGSRVIGLFEQAFVGPPVHPFRFSGKRALSRPDDRPASL